MLTIGPVQEPIDILVALRSVRVAGENRPTASGHPGWCGRQEGRGEPHRSPAHDAAVWRNDDRVRMWLAQGVGQADPVPMTHAEMWTDGHRLEWPPLTPQQHDTLPGKLTHLLERLPIAGVAEVVR